LIAGEGEAVIKQEQEDLPPNVLGDFPPTANAFAFGLEKRGKVGFRSKPQSTQASKNHSGEIFRWSNTAAPSTQSNVPFYNTQNSQMKYDEFSVAVFNFL